LVTIVAVVTLGPSFIKMYAASCGVAAEDRSPPSADVGSAAPRSASVRHDGESTIRRRGSVGTRPWHGARQPGGWRSAP
jgi:hypothetical protein